MLIVRTVSVLFFLLLLSGCSPLPARYDLDSSIDFSHYHSYQWRQRSFDRVSITDNSLIEKRIQTTIDRHLSNRGLERTDNSPDFIMNYHIVTRERLDIRDYGYDYYWPYRYGMYPDIYSYTEGTLILDMIDAKTDKLIWRGWTSRAINQHTLPPKTLESILLTIMKKFPR